MSDPQVIKFTFDGALRRISIPKAELSFDRAKALVADVIRTPAAAIEMRYADEDGDNVTVGSDVEFQAALRHFKDGAARFIVETTEPKNKKPRADAAAPAPAAPAANNKKAEPEPAKKKPEPAAAKPAEAAKPKPSPSPAPSPSPSPSPAPAPAPARDDPVSQIQALLSGLGLDVGHVAAFAERAAEQAAAAARDASRAVGDAARRAPPAVEQQLASAIEALVEGAFIDRARAADLAAQLRALPRAVLDLFLAVVAAAQSTLSGPETGLAGARHWADCDHCRAPVRGWRYKCGNCADYDLCAACERLPRAGVHDVTHVFLKIMEPLAAHGARALARPLLPFNLYRVGGPGAAAPGCPPRFCGGAGGAGGGRCPAMACHAPPAAASPAAAAAAAAASPAKLASRFVCDVTVPDGTSMAPGASFSKIWRFRNSGDVAFPAGVRLEHVGGDNLGAGRFSDPMPALAPNAECDVEVAMRAPMALGRYVSYWRHVSPAGDRFGHRVWCDVIVADERSDISLRSPAADAADARDESDDEAEEEEAEEEDQVDDGDDAQMSFVRVEHPAPATAPAPAAPAPAAPAPAAPAPAAPVASAPARFSDELSQLRSMGFGDEGRALRLLEKENGDLLRTVSALLRDEDGN